MYAWAVGKLGLSERQYYNMSFNALSFKISAYLEKECKEWERARFIACTLINVNLPKGKQISPEKLMQLPTDEKPDLQQQINELINML
jgi:hypothetical protein